MINRSRSQIFPVENTKETSEIHEILLKNTHGFHESKAEIEYLKNQLAAAEKKFNEFQNTTTLVRKMK